MSYPLEVPSPAMHPTSIAVSLNPQPEWVRAASKGDCDAYKRLVDSTRNVVCSIALSTLRDVATSEDIAQEVYLAAWKHLATLRNPTSFLPWIRQLTRNHCLEYLRRAGRRERHYVTPARMDEALSLAIDPTGTPADVLIQNEERQRIAEAIDELGEDAREVVILFYREGRSIAQVAALLDLQEPTVKKRLSRARSQLRAALLERAGELFERTAPGAAFTGAVVGIITIGAPATASAAGVGFAKTLGGASPLAKAAYVVGIPFVGIASAVGAVWFGLQRLLQVSRDDIERSKLRRFRAVNVALVAGTLLGTIYLTPNPHGIAWVVVPYALYAVAIAISYGVWLPRITAARRAIEQREDAGAHERHQREKLRTLTGIFVGIALGAAGVYSGLRKTGLVP